MAISGAQKVAEANRQASSGQVGGAVTTSGQIVQAGGKVVGGAGTSKAISPKDSPSYVAGSSPDDKVGPITQMNNELSKTLPTGIDPNAQAPQNLIDQVKNAQQQVDNLASQKGMSFQAQTDGSYKAVPKLGDQYTQAKEVLDKSGVATPQGAGAGSAMVGTAIKSLPKQSQFESTPQVDAFYLDDKNVQAEAQEIIDFLSPPSTQKMLMEGMKQIQSQQNQLAEDKLALMNIQTVMSGSAEDIAKEIESSGGLATSSQIAALAIGRNSTLLKQAAFLQNKVAMQQDLIANSTQLLQFEKEMANTQFTQRMGVLQYQRQNDKDMFNAFKDSVSEIQKSSGWRGVLQAYSGNPRQLAYVESLYGGVGSLAKLAATEQTSLGVSDTTQAIINNPSLFDDLTPTEKGRVINQLQGSGYDTSNLGLKGLSDTAIQSVAQTQKALDDLAILKTKIQGNTEKLGPITGLAAINPWSESRKLQADVDRVRQTVGKALEGGVLRKEDEEKYKKILATLTDTPSTAIYKIDALIGSVTRDIETYKSLQQSAGRSLNVSGKLQKTGEVTKPEDLRKKYNY